MLNFKTSGQQAFCLDINDQDKQVIVFVAKAKEEVEEGFEMLGATLFMIGFSRHYKNLQEKPRS